MTLSVGLTASAQSKREVMRVRVDSDGKTHFPEIITNSRAAIVYNFSQKYFIGSTFLFNTTLLGDNDDYTRQTKWRARAFFGIRL